MVCKLYPSEWHPYRNYHALNNTQPNCYSILNLQYFSLDLHRSTIFSKIELVHVFKQIPLEPAEIPKTTVTMPFGLFEFVHMPFGLSNTAHMFQQFTDQVLSGIPSCYNHFAIILVASHSPEEHLQHLCQLLMWLRDYSIWWILISVCLAALPSPPSDTWSRLLACNSWSRRLKP